MDRKQDWLDFFSRGIRQELQRIPLEFSKLQEIRLRAGAPLMVWYDSREYTISCSGKLVQPSDRSSSICLVTGKDIRETVECMGNYSLYAFEDEIRQGFLTLRGGHRAGLTGKAVMDQGELKMIRCISGINLRFAHQVIGCASPYMEKMMEQGRFCHSLLVSPPRCGKTTLLRDMVRLLSDGFPGFAGVNVGVVDERSEIGACYDGIPQNDLGIRTDILDCCPKALGMMMLIRTMSPQIIAVDEIGGKQDLEAIRYGVSCGCGILATVHGASLEDLRQKPVLGEMLQEGIFKRFLVLGHTGRPGQVVGIYDERGRAL